MQANLASGFEPGHQSKADVSRATRAPANRHHSRIWGTHVRFFPLHVSLVHNQDVQKHHQPLGPDPLATLANLSRQVGEISRGCTFQQPLVNAQCSPWTAVNAVCKQWHTLSLSVLQLCHKQPCLGAPCGCHSDALHKWRPASLRRPAIRVTPKTSRSSIVPHARKTHTQSLAAHLSLPHTSHTHTLALSLSHTLAACRTG